MATAIWWIRRDLRLTDNQALAAALRYAHVIPVFILDTVLWNSEWVGEKRLAFLLGGLRALEQSLRERGSRLILRQGHPLEVLTDLVKETNAAAILAEADYSPYARQRDAAVARSLPLCLMPGVSLYVPGEVLKQEGTPYVVYTPFSRACKALPQPTLADLFPAPTRLVSLHDTTSLAVPDTPELSAAAPFRPGEEEAHRRLDAFVGQWRGPIAQYAGQRDRIDLDGTSTLSPYLRFGMVSIRQVAVKAWDYFAAACEARDKEAQRGAEVWLNELLWREFYIHILYHFPHVRRGSFRPEYDQIAWRTDEGQLAAWRRGHTGFPVVDAAMRQLQTTGWMHNRARMIVASFLVKDLLMNWQEGEKWFMQQLIDGDPAANNGGWQWTAGTDTDATPYFRIFNPVSQGQKFDPGGVYIRRWVPELARVPTKWIHAPWAMPLVEQRATGCLIGQNYSEPLLDRRQTRGRTLEAYAAVKRT